MEFERDSSLKLLMRRQKNEAMNDSIRLKKWRWKGGDSQDLGLSQIAR